jgi:ribonuclease HI
MDMMHDPYALTVHIDGSAYRNPGEEGGLAGIVIFPDALGHESVTIFELGFTSSTNNRMELQACIEALEWARLHARDCGASRVVIITDSDYVHRHQWNAPTWGKNHWRNKDGRPIENADQ